MEMDVGDPGSGSGSDEADRLRLELEETRSELRAAQHDQKILEQITSGAKDFAILLMAPDGKIVHWNEGAERMMGYGSREIQGQDARILFPPEDRARNAPARTRQKSRSRSLSSVPGSRASR